MALFDFIGSGLSGLGNLISESMPALNLGSIMSPLESIGSTIGSTASDIGSGLKSAGGSVLGGIKEYAGPAANALGAASMIGQIPLGIMAMRQAGKGTDAMMKAIETQQQLAKPALEAEQQLYPAGTSALMTGQLPPELETQVNNQVNQYEQQMLQQLVAQGMPPEQARAIISGQVGQMRNQLTMQAAESLLGGAGSAAGTGLQGSYMSGSTGGQLYNTASGVINNAQRNLNQLLAGE